MPRSISRVVFWCALLALVAAAGGCQCRQTWNLAPVEGTVTKDGHPLAGIQVTFWTDVEAGTQGPRTSGVTDAAGHYELHTDSGDRGAAIGRYRVCLLVPRSDGLPRRSGPRRKDRTRQANQSKDKADKPPTSDTVQLPPAYSSFAETPLRLEVHTGPQIIDLEVK